MNLTFEKIEKPPQSSGIRKADIMVKRQLITNETIAPKTINKMTTNNTDNSVPIPRFIVSRFLKGYI